MPTLTAASLTDTGRVRKINQDSVAVFTADQLECRLDGLFVVADGMGGKAGGEIASRVAVETVPDVVQEVLNELTDGAGAAALSQALREGLEAANNAVYTQARANPELRGMGTTCVAALLRDGQALIGNVGDSRVYLLRGGRLSQVTDDHSLVQEHVRAGELTEEQARGSRFKNVITRAIGIANTVEPDIHRVDLEPGDTLLLCSDGLTNMVSEPDIEWMLSDQDVERTCRKLVDAANRNGGVDNITAVVVRYGEALVEVSDRIERDVPSLAASSVVYKTPSAPSRWPVSSLVLAAVAAVLGLMLIMVGGEVYQLSAGWPFIKHRPAPNPAVVAPPARPDYARLTYGEPAMIVDRAVRPEPLVCDPAGNVFVVAADSGTVLRVSNDGRLTVFVASDAAPRQSRNYRHWAVDPAGNLYVASSVEKRIVKYDPMGARLGTLGDGKLKGPEAVAVDEKGAVYVIDGNRLKVFRPLDPTTQRPNDATTQIGAPDGSR
jgi:protein phosphatase